MKRIILTLCVFIALSSLADAARFYRCVDRDGNTIMTDNPPPDAKCESRGASPDLTPQEHERERRQNEAEQEARKIDSISAIEKQRTEGLQKEARNQIDNRIKEIKGSRISEGRKAEMINQLLRKRMDFVGHDRRDRQEMVNKIDNRIREIKGSRISEGRKAEMINQLLSNRMDFISERTTDISHGNQRGEESVKQQREMEDKTNAINAQMMRQQAEIQSLHMNQMMQQIDKNFGR